MKRARARDVTVLARCHWPCDVEVDDGVERLGFDVRELLAEAKQILDAGRDGQARRARAVPPRFSDELTPLASAA
jgi:hypothetical protein